MILLNLVQLSVKYFYFEPYFLTICQLPYVLVSYSPSHSESGIGGQTIGRNVSTSNRPVFDWALRVQ